MPRYYAVDTAIKLFVWDPASAGNNDHDGSHPETPTPRKPNEPLSIHALEAPKARRAGRLPMRTKPKSQSTDPADGCCVEELREEYFEGREGVDFLGYDMPFFLINSGKDLFTSSQAADVQQELSQSRKSELRHALLDISGSSVPRDSAHAHEVDVESTLSSVSSSFFVPRVSNGPNPDSSGAECASEPPRGFSKNPNLPFNRTLTQRGPGVLRAGSSTVHNLRVNNESSDVVPKLLLKPKPVKIVVDLSQKSFIPSIFSNQMQELCINIFYNGELTHSRIIRPRSRRGPAENEKYHHYSGRRIDRNLEVPWIIRPDSLDDQSSLGPIEHSSFAERWSTTNQKLIMEADAWGRQGKYRSPMGEYLVELSKRPIPHSTEHHQNGTRSRAGIIDVVIALGVSLAVNKWSTVLREPRRKLQEDLCGKEKLHFVAPEIFRSSKSVPQMEQLEIAGAEADALPHQDSTLPGKGLTIQGRSMRSGTVHASTTPGEAHSKSLLSNLRTATECANISGFPLAADEQRKAAYVLDSAKKAAGVAMVAMSVELLPIASETPTRTRTPGSSSSQGIQNAHPEIFTPMTPMRSGTGMHQSLTSSSPITDSRRRTDLKLTTRSVKTGRGRLADLNSPKSVPQKRFRGPDLDLASLSSPKRAKMSNPLDFLPFDSEKPASLSTRSKRAAGNPIVATPESIRGEELVEGIQTSRRRRPDPQSFGVISSSPIHLEAEQKIDRQDYIFCSASNTLQLPTAPLSNHPFNSGDILVKESSSQSNPADHDDPASVRSEYALEGIRAIDCGPSEKLGLEGQKSCGSVETVNLQSKSKELLQNTCKTAEDNLQKLQDQKSPINNNVSSTEMPRKIRRLVLVSTGKLAESSGAGYSTNVESLDAKHGFVARNLRDRGNLGSTATYSGNKKRPKARCDNTTKSTKASHVSEDGQTQKTATIKGLDMIPAPSQTISAKNGRQTNEVLLGASQTSIPISSDSIKTGLRNCPMPAKKSMPEREPQGHNELLKPSMGIDTSTVSSSHTTNGTRSSRNSNTECKGTRRDVNRNISTRSKVIGSSATKRALQSSTKDTKTTQDPTPNLDANNATATAKNKRSLSNVVQPAEVMKTPNQGQSVLLTPQVNNPSTRNPHKTLTTSNLSVVSTLNCNTSINSPASEIKAQATPPHPPSSIVAADESPIQAPKIWKPNQMCEDSALSYAGTEGWNGVNYNPTLGRVCRTIRSEREGLFRASGILMGVRFVVGQ